MRRFATVKTNRPTGGLAQLVPKSTQKQPPKDLFATR